MHNHQMRFPVVPAFPPHFFLRFLYMDTPGRPFFSAKSAPCGIFLRSFQSLRTSLVLALGVLDWLIAFFSEPPFGPQPWSCPTPETGQIVECRLPPPPFNVPPSRHLGPSPRGRVACVIDTVAPALFLALFSYLPVSILLTNGYDQSSQNPSPSVFFVPFPCRFNLPSRRFSGFLI